MAQTYAVHDRILDPFNRQFFDTDTRFSQHVFSKQLNKFLGIVEDNCVLRGCDILDYTYGESSFEVQINAGEVVHDSVYFNFPNATWVTFYLYQHYNIVGLNQTFNYFVVSGNVSLLFKEADEFAVTGSTGNDDDYWVVSKTYYDDGSDETWIYVTSPITHPTANGEIIYRVVDDSNTTAKLLCYTKFTYLQTSDEYSLQFCLDYMANDGSVAHGWTNENKLILRVFDIQKNATDTEIISLTETIGDDIEIEGTNFDISNKTDLVLVDGGQL